MPFAPGDTVYLPLPLTGADGNPADADATPAVVVNRNGADDGAVVSAITHHATGLYFLAVPLPSSYVVGMDQVHVRATGAVAGISFIRAFLLGKLDHPVASGLVLSVPAAQIAAVLQGGALTIQRGDTLVIPLTGLGNLTGRSKLWFTLKRYLSDADSASLIQVTESGGLLCLNGAAASSGDGSLVVTDSTLGAATVTVKAPEVAALPLLGNLHWDVQMLTGAGVVTTLTQGSAAISGDVTEATQ